MASVAYPRLSNLFDISDLPPQLQVLQPAANTAQQALEKVHYRGLVVQPGSSSSSLAANLELVSYQAVRLDIVGSGFNLVINPEEIAADGVTALPLAVSYSLGISQFLPFFKVAQLPTSADELFDLWRTITGVTDTQLLRQASVTFEVPATTQASPLAKLAQRVNSVLGPTHGVTVQLPTPANDEQLLNQLLAAFKAASPALSVAQAILELYVADASPAAALANLAQLLTSPFSDMGLDFLRRLLIPQISAKAYVSVGIEVPRSILLPVKLNQDGTYSVDTDASTRTTIVFAKGIFQFNTTGGFGYEVEVAASLAAAHPRAQLGNTGIQVAFASAKLDLSENTNIAEADADGRPSNFRGFYAKEVDIFLPDGWTTAPGSVQLAATNLLVGTGGVSGTFGVKATAPAPTGLAPGVIVQARLFGDIVVKFNTFDLTMSQNEVTRSGMAGTFSLPTFKDDKGKVIEFPFDLRFSAAGYELSLRAGTDAKGKTLPAVVKLPAGVELHFTRLAFGKDDHGVYLDLVADVVVTRALPIVGKAMPNKIAISKLRVDTDKGITVAAQPVWADGTTTAKPLGRNDDLVQAMNLTIAKVLKVDHLHLSLPGTADALTANATFDATLGLTDDSTATEPSADGTPPPGFRASISNAGFSATLTRVPKDPVTGASTSTTKPTGNLGLLDVQLGLKLPDAASVSINAGGLVGAGKLAILDGGTRYEGALALTFRDTLHLSAYALLSERLPDGSPGPSLLALVTAQFEPVQLGLGFTLKGVGGLLGLHRTADTDYLRTLVRSGKMDELLFPDNVLDNLTSALTTINAAFPAARGRYVIGLLAQLGWGTPELISLDVALLVELPAPVRLLVLGVLRAMLPTRQNDILSLRADFLGAVDFGAKKVSFDASLIDSRLWKFTLSGDVAFRLFQGDNPVFVLTAGGFHPSYQPPAGAALTGLKRITLALAKSNDLRLTLDSYFAVTSNTVQFGAHLALYYAICRGLHVEGNFSFDALFQLNPFHVEVGVEAGVAIKRGGSSLLSLHLSLHVTGPGPWHVWGEASFKIWFIKISVDVDATIGERTANEPTLVRPDVYTPLRAALLDGANWLVEAPANALPSGVVLRPASAAAGQVFLDPRGAIALRQRVAPLGVRLQKFGSNPLAPTGGDYFEVPAFLVGDTTYSVAATPDNVELTRDFFAPSQYYKLTDGEKLSRPSFELLPNGLRITSLATLVNADTATRRVVEYEQLLLDGAATGTAAGGSTSSTRLAGGAGTTRLSPDTFGKLARGSALGQAVAAARPSQRAPAPVGWAPDTYEVVRADTLALYDPADADAHYAGHEKFGSQLEADQYCQALVAADATLAGELLVVPTYELALA